MQFAAGTCESAAAVAQAAAGACDMQEQAAVEAARSAGMSARAEGQYREALHNESAGDGFGDEIQDRTTPVLPAVTQDHRRIGIPNV
jgi:hypothetical protein